MLKPYSKIKDLESRGGEFIRKQKIGKTITGEIYTGTAYYNDGDHAEIKVLIYPYGGTRIIDRADNSEECRKDFVRLLKYLDSLEQTAEYRRTLINRMVLHIIMQIARFYLIGHLIKCTITYMPTLELPKILILAMNIILIFMIRTIRNLIESEF